MDKILSQVKTLPKVFRQVRNLLNLRRKWKHLKTRGLSSREKTSPQEGTVHRAHSLQTRLKASLTETDLQKAQERARLQKAQERERRRRDKGRDSSRSRDKALREPLRVRALAQGQAQVRRLQTARRRVHRARVLLSLPGRLHRMTRQIRA